jgi:hypothetical protein
VRTSLVPAAAWQPAARGPSAVAIHDDGDMEPVAAGRLMRSTWHHKV